MHELRGNRSLMPRMLVCHPNSQAKGLDIDLAGRSVDYRIRHLWCASRIDKVLSIYRGDHSLDDQTAGSMHCNEVRKLVVPISVNVAH